MKPYGKLYVLDAAADWGTAGTRLIDIKVRDLISVIFIRFKLTVATASATTATLASTVSKIELVDGSRILFSMSGERAQAMAYYMTGQFPFSKMSLTAAGFDQGVIPVMFGRWAGDAEYALDPNAFNNLQLKVTYDEDAASASVVVNEFEVDCLTVPKSYAGSRKGFIMAKDVKTYAMAASSHEYSELPVDYPLYGLLIQGRSTDHDPCTLLSSFGIDLNNNSEVLYDETFSSYYQQYVKAMYGYFIQQHTADNATTANTVYADFSMDGQIQYTYDGTAVTASGELANATVTGHVVSVEATVAIKKNSFQLSGGLPHGCFPVPFMGMDMRPLWSISNRDSLRLDVLTSSDADSGDTGVITALQIHP